MGDILARRIATTGPMSLADWMADCLLHPRHGYYATRDPFGVTGDFTTAPEISQMFGEMLGLALAQSWLEQGAPAAFVLAELGPGRGTLMADILRATRAVPGFTDAAEVLLVEASPALREIQRQVVPEARHIDSLADLPERPVFLVANEFFDALPIQQFQRSETGWHEVLIGIDGQDFGAGLSDGASVPALAHRLDDTHPGDIVEHCPALPGIVGGLGAHIAAHGGAALIIDYGDWRSLGDTLQALKGHKPVNPFQTPGEADLTAHVDFESVASAAAPAKFTKLTPQGVFLERLGITDRAQVLAQNLSGAELESHIAAHRRLTHPSEMGHLFKVMGLYPDTASPPPGLEP